MCGLAAIFAYNYPAPPVDEKELLAIRESMRTRGPDGEGLWIADDERVGLAHRRLAIIDPRPDSNQPFFSPDGRHAIVFNGEIYNFRELRAELVRDGIEFRTDSDTEVLLHWLIRHGTARLTRLRGMFAFAFWNGGTARLLLARDPYGIKPLYIADDGWTVRVASQVKALRAGGAIDEAMEPAAQVGFLLWGSVPEPFTLFQEIRAIPAGHYVEVSDLGPSTATPFARLPDLLRTDSEGCSVTAALRECVATHLVADVPVAVFLSAGIDSGAILGLCRDAGSAPTAVTIGFDEFSGSNDDEVPLAAEVSRHYAVEHVAQRVSAAEYEADLPRIRDAMDQPSIDGVNTWFAAKAAAERGLKVALSGIGGDELFGGYPSFSELPRWRRAFRWPAIVPGLGRMSRMMATPLLSRAGLSPKTAGMIEFGGDWAGLYLLRRGLFMPWELEGVLPKETVRAGLERLDWNARVTAHLDPDPGYDHGRVLALESGLYLRNQLLRDADWAGMAHSVEIRTPLVDSHLLMQLAGPLRRGIDKSALADAPGKPLPDSVVRRSKTGFGVPAQARTHERGLAGVPLGTVSRRVALDLLRRT